jgi:hypothetical protein
MNALTSLLKASLNPDPQNLPAAVGPFVLKQMASIL